MTTPVAPIPRRWRRNHAALIAAGLGALIAALAVVLITRPTDTTSSAPSGPTSKFAGPVFPAGLRASPFSLQDQDGKPATLAQYRGQVIVLSFMYSRCRDTCPVMATEIRGALDALPQAGRGIPVLAITVDPAHDTPASARAFIARDRMTGRMRFLLGSYRQLRPIYKRYAIQPEFDQAGREYSHGHSSFVMLIDRGGLLRVGFSAGNLVPEDLTHDLNVLIAPRPASRH